LAIFVHVSLGWIFLGSFQARAGAVSEKPTIDKIKRARKAPLVIVGEVDRPKPVPVSHVLAMPGDPPRVCRTCEHYDGGGLGAHGPLKETGDCHNGISGRFTTTASESCIPGWYPCTTRWPLHKRMGIEPA
jgi:hypothetical protein